MSKKNTMFDNLLQDLERTRRRQKICKKNLNENINQVIGALQSGVANIQNNNVMEEENSKQVQENVSELSNSVLKMQPLDKILNTHKEYFAYVSKFGKDIEKTFNKEINTIFTKTHLEEEQINNAIHEHYLREGKTEIYETLARETRIEDDANVEKNFYVLQNILQECRKQNLEPALEWAHSHEAELNEIDSDLIFLLYQQKFILEITTQGKEKAVDCAKRYFPGFYTKYTREVERIMGSLLFEKSNPENPYADLYDDSRWEELAGEIAYEACRIYKTTPESALSIIVSAGTVALPKFLKYFNLAKENNIEWNENFEIPVAIELGKEYHFHSIFVCPVTKDTSTPDNPPMMLRCGHVISELAVKKLAGLRSRFKCPYCPVEQNPSQIKKLIFN